MSKTEAQSYWWLNAIKEVDQERGIEGFKRIFQALKSFDNRRVWKLITENHIRYFLIDRSCLEFEWIGGKVTAYNTGMKPISYNPKSCNIFEWNGSRLIAKQNKNSL